VHDGEHAAEWRTTPLRASHRGGRAEITRRLAPSTLLCGFGPLAPCIRLRPAFVRLMSEKVLVRNRDE
jgi:hypothetical protein